MTTINNYGYVVTNRGGEKKRESKGLVPQNFFMVKYDDRSTPMVNLGKVRMPLHLAGKRVRFKLEIIED
jgi:hypothetical protein